MKTPSTPITLRVYFAATRLIPIVAPWFLKRRLARGKEDDDRWVEKLGQSTLPRPDGPLIWLNAVGLGEVMSLRGLIAELSAKDPTLNFLVTSSTKQSADTFAANLPQRTIHSYLPLDSTGYRKSFLDHFQPDAALWVEQDFWPGFVVDLAKRDIPQAIIAGRMNAQSFARHRRFSGLFRALYHRLSFVTAMEPASALNLSTLGAQDVTVSGSLKPSSPALVCDQDELAKLSKSLENRFVWLAASTYSEDETIAIAAHKKLLEADPTALLIIVPRQVDRPVETELSHAIRSKGDVPDQEQSIWICDTIGELGLFYRLASAALIGGTHNDIHGHNPWEAIALDCPVLHGPNTQNFAQDYADLDAARAAFLTPDATSVFQTLRDPELVQSTKAAKSIRLASKAQLSVLADRILAMLDNRND